jgi:hypothetical protein
MIEKIKRPSADTIDRPHSRLRGTLVGTVGERAMRLATGIDPATSERSSERTANLAELEIAGLMGSAREIMPILDDETTLLIGAEMSGMWHYSSGRIDNFSEAVAENNSGKFGRGTYFGIGDLRGETIDFLKDGDTIRHDVAFTGNVMVVDRRHVIQVAEKIKTQRGLPSSRVRASTPTSPLTDLIEGVKYDGQTVDAILVVMDKDKTSAELIVTPKAVSNVSVLDAG